jgi:hypothetical protein
MYLIFKGKLKMKFRLTRRRLLVSGLSALVLASVAWANHQDVIHFVTPASVTAGQNFEASVQVNVAPMAVSFTSNPPGLVNYTTTVTSVNQAVSIPTNGAAPAGNYALVATPVGGGGSQNHAVQAMNPSNSDL